jgi:hypothetical protein
VTLCINQIRSLRQGGFTRHNSTQSYPKTRGLSWSSPGGRGSLIKQPALQQPDRSGVLKWAGALMLVAIILAGVIGHYSQGLKVPATPQHAAPVVQPKPIPTQPVSQPPVPPPPAVSTPRARLVLYKRWAGNGVWELVDSTRRVVKILVDPAPRPQLVNPPAPKAELVQAHGAQIGQIYSFIMPIRQLV